MCENNVTKYIRVPLVEQIHGVKREGHTEAEFIKAKITIYLV